MKNLYPNQFKALFFSVLFFALQSCMVTPGQWKNNQISNGKRDDFHQLNAEALKYLKANDPKGLKSLLSKEMISDNNERKVELISNRLNDNAYRLLDEYYVAHKAGDTDMDTVKVKDGSVNRYALMYPCEAQEMYMAYFIPEKSANKYMLSLVYAKLNYGWKIIKMELEPYTIDGKTAPELFNMAKEQYAKKEIQAAQINTMLAVTCFKPGVYWKYPDEDDAGRFYTQVHEEVNAKYQYPLVLSQLTTGPMILRVYNKNTDDGFNSPVIYYMTHFDLKDTTDVKKENLKVREAVAKLMPGLDEGKKYILYSAFNKKPDGYNSVDHFDMTQKLN
jgi:hypothetical protein